MWNKQTADVILVYITERDICNRIVLVIRNGRSAMYLFYISREECKSFIFL